MGIEYVLLSHVHYDHCDKSSLHQLKTVSSKA
jgi:L-ascorbate metabolism protein UlaG (beta-lactamase superfamily)